MPAAHLTMTMLGRCAKCKCTHMYHGCKLTWRLCREILSRIVAHVGHPRLHRYKAMRHHCPGQALMWGDVRHVLVTKPRAHHALGMPLEAWIWQVPHHTLHRPSLRMVLPCRLPMQLVIAVARMVVWRRHCTWVRGR